MNDMPTSRSLFTFLVQGVRIQMCCSCGSCNINDVMSHYIIGNININIIFDIQDE